MATRNNKKKGQVTARESTLRNEQKAAFDGRSTNLQPAAVNTQDTSRGMIEGLTAGSTYGEGQAIKTQISEGGGLPNTARESTLRQAQSQGLPQMQLGNLDRATEKINENILTGAMPLRPGNITIQDESGFPIARPNTEFKNSDMVSAYVQSGFNDDILNILIRTV